MITAQHDSWDLAELDALVAADDAAKATARQALIATSRTPMVYAPATGATRSAARRPVMLAPAPMIVPASAKQFAFIRSLIARKHEATVAATMLDILDVAEEQGTLAKGTASSMIEELLALPNPAPVAAAAAATAAPKAAAAPVADIPAGRYAITGNDGSTDFYRVDRPTEGKWAGWTFVKLIVGGHEDRPIRGAAAATILARIANADGGPAGALRRFGIEIGICGHCGRTLTDEASRAAGIGPVCAAGGF